MSTHYATSTKAFCHRMLVLCNCCNCYNACLPCVAVSAAVPPRPIEKAERRSSVSSLEGDLRKMEKETATLNVQEHRALHGQGKEKKKKEKEEKDEEEELEDEEAEDNWFSG